MANSLIQAHFSGRGEPTREKEHSLSDKNAPLELVLGGFVCLFVFSFESELSSKA